MKNFWIVVILLAMGGGLFFALKGKHGLMGKNEPSTQSPDTESAPISTSNRTPSENIPPASPLAVGPNPASSPATPAIQPNTVSPATNDIQNISPITVLENVSHSIHQYGDMFGGNPVGTNPEITAALNGGNPKQVNFIQPEAGMKINGSGELVDSWGTPYFFHQLSGTDMEIHSAGPDKIMWTTDDLITH